MKGWVYIISNPAMPRLVKVGYSLKDPESRAQELNNSGVPHEYEVDYAILVDEPHDLEQRIHAYLKNINQGKEWFRCSAEQVVAAIRDVHRGKIYCEDYKKVNRERVKGMKGSRFDAVYPCYYCQEKISTAPRTICPNCGQVPW